MHFNVFSHSYDQKKYQMDNIPAFIDAVSAAMNCLKIYSISHPLSYYGADDGPIYPEKLKQKTHANYRDVHQVCFFIT